AVVLVSGAVDQFGNPMGQDYAFNFTAGNVTGNNDTFRITRESSGVYDVFVNNSAMPDFTYPANTAKIMLSGGAGNDTLIVDDTASTNTPNLVLNSPNTSAQDITGLGSAIIEASSDIEHLTINTGSGVAIIDIETFKTG